MKEKPVSEMSRSELSRCLAGYKVACKNQSNQIISLKSRLRSLRNHLVALDSKVVWLASIATISEKENVEGRKNESEN